MVLFLKSLLFVAIFVILSNSVSSSGKLKPGVSMKMKSYRSLRSLSTLGRTITNVGVRRLSNIGKSFKTVGVQKMSSMKEGLANMQLSEFKKEVERLILLTYVKYRKLNWPDKPPVEPVGKTNKKASEIPDEQTTRAAARTMFAIALANGFIKPKENGDIADLVNDFTNSLATASDETITTKLASYIPKNLNWFIEYRTQIRNGKYAVEAMSLAMEKVNNFFYSKQHQDQDKGEKYGIIDRSKYPKLGCDFKGDEFSYKGESRWNKERPPMNFDSMVTFKGFVDGLKNKIIPSVMQSTRYNDVDQLIRFVSEFESGSLNDFYSNYKYKVRTSEDTIVFESKFIEQLEIHYPKFVEHLYLISVEMDVLENPKFIPDSIKKFDPVKDAPKISEREFNINHVAGAFKFSITDEGTERTGFMIIDLNIPLNVPIILMEDGEPPHLEGCGNTFTWFNGTTIARAYLYDVHGVAKRMSTLLYTVRQPFCAFVKEVYKPNLIMPVHGMLARHVDGSKKSFINFQIQPKDILGEDHYFNIVTYAFQGMEDINSMTSKQIRFADLLTNGTELGTSMQQVAKDLGMSYERLWGKLVAVKLLVFDQKQIVDKFFKANLKKKNIDANSGLVSTNRARVNSQKSFDYTRGGQSERYKKEDAFHSSKKFLSSGLKRTHITILPRFLLELSERAIKKGRLVIIKQSKRVSNKKIPNL